MWNFSGMACTGFKQILSLPPAKGGQGLVDITSKILSFRLTTLCQPLYKEVLSWRPLASCLLQQAGKLRYGPEFLLLDLRRIDTSLLPPFYQSLLNASQCVIPVRNEDSYKFCNLMCEPVFYNSLFHHDYKSRSLIQSFIESGFFLVRDFVNHTYSGWQTPNQILEVCHVKSARLIGHLLHSIVKVFNYLNLSWPPLHGAQDTSTTHPDFPGFCFSRAPSTKPLQTCTKTAALYVQCLHVVISANFLPDSTLTTHWKELLPAGVPSSPAWSSMYTSPVSKRAGDTQWRLPPHSLPSNVIFKRLNLALSDECPFSRHSEDIFEAYVGCQGWFCFFNSWNLFSRNLVCVFLSIILCTMSLYLARMSDLKLQTSFSLK